MTLRLTLRTPPDQRLDLSPLTPHRLAGFSAQDIERLPLQTTRTECRVADIFRVAIGDPENIVIEGGSNRFDNVGHAMQSGTLLLDGDCGLYAASRMTAGRLEIRGHTGPWAASGLTGGDLLITGNTGDFVGAPLAGERTGMAGGTVLVRGRAGNRAGDRMRRGLIVIEGDAGEAPASRMVAGTLVVCGTAGRMAGMLMRRGTLLLSAEPAGGLLPTFVEVGGETGVFLRLLSVALRDLSPAAATLADQVEARFMGDAATLGRGEALLSGS